MGFDEKKRPLALNLTPARTMSASSVSTVDSTSTSSSLAKPPRTPRFAEDTAVHSPVDPKRLPFSEKSQFAQAQPGDVGFGYIGAGAQRESVAMPMTPRSPLKSALRVPGTPGRALTNNPLSPTFKEEQSLESREKSTDKEQARDLVSRHHHQHRCQRDRRLTPLCRKSRRGYAWPSSPSAASTSAAASSSCP